MFYKLLCGRLCTKALLVLPGGVRPRPGVPTLLGVSERYKYSCCPELEGDIDELYDLEEDPLELRNLIADPAHADVLTEVYNQLMRQLDETGYPSSVLAHPLEQ